ncbi:MAG: ParB/RepB/Spo0J family partition protein [Candidatus Margulisbacteria bacterium]|nr:ParB/RepB/Spo0J family partition protein [Candidatus Margulisiibacteriota bacterium]
MKIKQIRLDKLNYSSPQVRKDLAGGLDELKASIETSSVLIPLIVRKMGKEYVVIDGNRRLMALDELGAKPSSTVPALVVAVHKDKEALRLEMVANLVRSNFAPIEEAEVVNLLVNSYKMLEKEVAEALGRSKGRVNELLKIFKLPREIVAALRRDKITINHARTLARYINDKALVIKIYERIVKEKIGSEDITSIAYIMSLKGKSGIPPFRPFIENRKDGSRIKIEPRKKTIRIEINYNPEGKLESVLDIVKQKIAKIF